jgi:hypothetical protein
MARASKPSKKVSMRARNINLASNRRAIRKHKLSGQLSYGYESYSA